MAKRKHTIFFHCLLTLKFKLPFFSFFLLPFTLELLPSFSSAQYSFSRWDSIAVKVSDTTLRNPWAGGLNFPQFSTIDLDGNGSDDLFVFDRTGNKILTFINLNIPDSAAFVHRPQYQELFPYMVGWTLLADYNYDGKQDIFTANPKGGVTVYRNDFSASTGLKFTLADSMLKAESGINKYEVYVSPWDIPAISDIDNDGDLDILSFSVGGTFVSYYKNTSIDSFGIPDSLVFTIDDGCWGKFMEASESCDITLGISCKKHFSLPEYSKGGKHAGSTLLALDLDGDEDKELLLGDLICNNIVQLTNGGDIFSANMIGINKQFPPDFPVKIAQFPAAFFLDVDNDNKKDLIAAPCAINISENFTGIWFYKNTGSNSVPQFEFRTKSFLQNEMIETGEGANAAFFDADGDGLSDMIIGNYGYYKPGTTYVSELSFYKNTGTDTVPSFELVTRNYAGVAALGLTGVHPCFGDIDGDGDTDMLIGETNGELYLFSNSAAAGNPASFTLSSPGYKNIDVGLFSTPQLVDVDRDGRLDLLIGERNGNLNYYKNTGTVYNADYTLMTDSFGKINILEPQAITGYSVPRLVEIDSIPQYSLLVAGESGKIYLYKNIEGNLDGAFSEADTMFLNIREGSRSTIDAADINNDNNPDLVIGNYSGGVAIYKNNAPPKEPKQPEDTFSLKVFPNPSSGYFYVNIPEIKSSAEIFLFNLLGQSVLHRQINTAGKYYINTKNYAAGIYYFILIADEMTMFNEKVVFLK